MDAVSHISSKLLSALSEAHSTEQLRLVPSSQLLSFLFIHVSHICLFLAVLSNSIIFYWERS